MYGLSNTLLKAERVMYARISAKGVTEDLTSDEEEGNLKSTSNHA